MALTLRDRPFIFSFATTKNVIYNNRNVIFSISFHSLSSLDGFHCQSASVAYFLPFPPVLPPSSSHQFEQISSGPAQSLSRFALQNPGMILPSFCCSETLAVALSFSLLHWV